MGKVYFIKTEDRQYVKIGFSTLIRPGMKLLGSLVLGLAIIGTPAFARHAPSYCASCSRNSKGKIKRSSSAKHEFERSHPCPSTGKTSGGCKGYVIDHVTPLKRGGEDAPSNMQWQTKAEAKAKDRTE